MPSKSVSACRPWMRGLAALAAGFLSLSAAASIEVTSPNGSERFLVGQTYDITWTAPVTISSVRIEYSSNGGTAWNLFRGTTPNDGSEAWTVPNIPSAFCVVRVSDVADGTQSDTSDGVFRVEPAGSWPFIVTKTSGEVIVSFLGGDSAADSEIGFGYATATTPPEYRHILFQDIPDYPSPTADQSLGFLPAGSGLDFYVITLGQSAYSGNRPNESFSDIDNDHGWGDTAVTDVPGDVEGYLLHLDRCTGGIDDDNDFLIEVKVIPVGESPPVAVVQTPSGVQSGDVRISYTLKDTQGDPCTISVRFSQDGGLNWDVATMAPGGDGVSNLISSRTGQNHVFVWDSFADIGQTDQSDIRIRITPADTQIGTPGETSNFRVDNVPPPELSVFPDSFAFEAMELGPDPQPSTLKVWNSGGDELDWQVASDAPWLLLDPILGQSTGEQDTVNVLVSIAGFPAGDYDATITVTCTQLPGQTIHVPVTLTLTEAIPILAVSPEIFDFSAWEGGDNPDPQQFQIQNVGGHTMSWQVEATMPWLILSPESGSSQGEVDTVEVAVDIAGLTIGEYAAHINVTADSNAMKSIPVLLTITEPPPLLSVSPATITFNAVEGDDNILPQAIVIQNVGTGEFSWELSDDAAWLSVSPGTGTNSGEADSVLAGVSIAGLAPGAYFATITVTATTVNSPQEVDVTLLIAEKPPTLFVSPAVLNFSGVQGDANPPSQKLTVKNVGNGNMDWHASKDMAWLGLSPQEGASAGEEDEIQVSVDLANLTPGLYAARITLASSTAVNSPVEIPVVLDVSEPPPCLVVSPLELAFVATEKGEDPPPQQIEIRNVGGGKLTWQASADSPWLSLFPTSGTVAEGTDKVQVQVTITDLSPDSYTATITVTTPPGVDNSPQTVSVTLVVNQQPAAILQVTPLSLDFFAEEEQGNPPPQEVHIQNVGGREMAWHVFSDSTYLTVSPNAGSSQGEEDVVQVSVDISTLSPGAYSGTLTVTAPGADHSPQIVLVTLTVEGKPPVLEVSPLSLNFQMEEGSASPTPQTFSIQNAGGGEMAWQLSCPQEWVGLSPTSGVNTGSPQSVQVSIVSEGMVPGGYSANVTVKAPGAEGSPQTVVVTFTVTEKPPVLTVSPSALSFTMEYEGAVPAPKTFAIQNTGGGKMQWQVSTQESWVGLAPVSGTNVGTPQFVQVSISSDGLAPGNYGATVTVEATGAQNSPQTVAITLLIKVVKPELHVSPDVLEFTTRKGGGNPPSQTFTLVTISPSGITWVASENASWLSLNPTTGTNQGEEDVIVASVNKAGLGIGMYEADITIQDAQRPNFTASVHVILRVEPIRVSTDYTSIQDAIDAAQAGDVVLVSAGRYRERIRMKSGIEVIGEDANTTFIDCDQQGTGVAFEQVDGAKLEGFTITRGTGEYFGKGAEVGGGIYISQSSPLISKCRIVTNSAVWGGGICLDAGSAPLLVDCEIFGNSAVIGGGVFCYDGASATITTTRIWGNVAEWYGGGLCLTGTSSLTLASCEITRNSASYDGAGISGNAGSHISLVNCTIAHNDAPEGASILIEGSSTLEAANSITWGNTSAMILMGSYTFQYCDLQETDLASGNGNISSDPLFLSPEDGDYHLLTCSPCIDMGWNGAKGLPATDLEGESRVMTGPLGEITDMGADELNPEVPIVLLDAISPEQGGMISLNYRLYHLLGTPCSVLVQYSRDGGKSWRKATRAAPGEGTFGLSSSATGEAHTFVWDSVVDEGALEMENVLLQVTPTAERQGTPRVGTPFSLDNGDADNDNDKLPDAWEQMIADADPDDQIFSPRDVLGSDDFDGDGNSNRTEYLVGTNPVDAGSCLHVSCARKPDGETVVSWPSVKGKVYRVLCTNGLENGWHVLSEPIWGTGNYVEYHDSSAGNATLRFYKVETE